MVRLGFDSRTIATFVLAVAVGVALGAKAGTVAGAAAGVVTVLAGLFAQALWEAATERRRQNTALARRRDDALAKFTAPVPVTDPGMELDSWRLSKRGVAWYLRPETEAVSFRPRAELDELRAWCVTEGHVAVRLVTGQGGAGKTRLALRLGQEMAASGWQSWWVPPGSERDAVAAVRDLGQPTTLLVDYAETRANLAGLLADVANDRDGPDMRVVLLARSTGEWWQQLANDADYRLRQLLEAVPPMILGPVTGLGGQRAVFDDAVTAFADRLGVARPDATLALADPDAVVLVVHAAALLAVLDHATGGGGDRRPQSDPDVLGDLLRHEARYWSGSAATRGLNLDPSVQRLVVAVGCLIGADAESDAAGLLARVPDLADSAARRGQIARWLHDLYPAAHDPAGPEGGEWIGPLRPDPIAEQLVVSELAARPELIPALFTGLDERRAAKALTILARATLRQFEGEGVFRAALAADLEHLAVPALSVVVETNAVMGALINDALAATPVSSDTLRRIAAAIPFPSLALAQTAVTVVQRLADESADRSQRAMWLVGLSNHLGNLGRSEKALATIEEAVTIYRQLAKARPGVYLPDLAMSLNNQSGRLGGLGRHEEALTAGEEAVTAYRQLANTRPDAFLPSLAASVSNQSLHLGNLGRREEALAAIEEAVNTYRQLADAHPDAFLPDLAKSLHNQASHLANVGRHGEALAAIEEAVNTYRQLADAHPDAFLPDLAKSLHNRAVHLEDLGQQEEALAAMEEAITSYRQLAGDHPEAFLPDLGASLNSQAVHLAEMGRQEQALAAIEEAITSYRRLAEDRPSAFMPDLAGSLNVKSLLLCDLGRPGDALAAVQEGTDLYRILAEASPGALHDLAKSLKSQSAHQTRQADAMTNLGFLLKGRGDLAEAEIWWRKAADERHPVAMTNLGMVAYQRGEKCEAETWWRKAAEVGQADAMIYLGTLFNEQGHTADAETWWHRAADLGHPTAMNTMGIILRDRGQITEAQSWWQKAADIGSPEATFNMGRLYQERGEVAAAETWLRKAADAGYAYAMNNLALLLENRGKTAEADNLLRKAAAMGNHDAMSNLGRVLMQHGEVAEAEEWLRKAAEAGHVGAMSNLGGWLLERDEVAEADKWLRKAASMGHPGAMYNFGELLHKRGEIVEAEMWRRKAVATGHPALQDAPEYTD